MHDVPAAVRKLRDSLHVEVDKKQFPTKSVLHSILQDADVIIKNNQLHESIMKLKDLGLLKDYQARVTKL